MEANARMDELLEKLAAVVSGFGAPAGDPVTATTDDEMVSATVGPDRRVRSIEADPRVLRRTPEELAAAIVEVVNQALSEVPERADTNGAMADLAQMRDESEQLLRQTTTELTDALKRMEDLFR